MPRPPSGSPLPSLPPAARRRELRLKMGLGQQQAADMLGVSRNTFGFWERDERTPKAGNARAYYAELRSWQQAKADRLDP